MTPTQYIKNTAFRSSVKRGNTPSSERRRSSLFSGSSSSYPDMFMQNTMPSEEDSNEVCILVYLSFFFFCENSYNIIFHLASKKETINL